MSSTIQTISGKMVDPFAMRPEDLSVPDIAHALSQLCRFTGHTSRFYSVAEHSVHVSYLVPGHFALAALLHDASEAYLNDIAAPIKARPDFAFYRAAEDRLLALVLRHFTGWEGEGLPTEVKIADYAMLHLEAVHLMAAPWAEPEWIHRAAGTRLRCWKPGDARKAFIDRFCALVADRGASQAVA